MNSYDVETAPTARAHADPDPDPRQFAERLGRKGATDVHQAPTVGAVLAALMLHPIEHLLKRWNWKSALLSALLRGAIFFFTNLISGWHAAVGAMFAELMLRAATSGFYGAITENLSSARPVWAASAVAMIGLPCMAHSVEFLVHWLRRTPKLGLSIEVSILFTAFSTAFNLYVMRRGVLVTTGKNAPLIHDLTQIPPLLVSFLLAGPLKIVRCLNHIFFGSVVRK